MLNGWAIVKKYALVCSKTVVLIRAHFFPEILRIFRSHSNACSPLISSKNHAPIKLEKKLIIPRQLCLVSPMAIKVKRSVIVKLEQ